MLSYKDLSRRPRKDRLLSAPINRFASMKPYGVYLSADDIGKKVMSPERLLSFARSVHAGDAINFLARMNVALQSEDKHQAQLQLSLLRTFFAPRDAQDVLSLARFRYNPFYWISPTQFRLLISVFVEHGTNEAAATLEERRYVRQLGDALISSTDVLPQVSDGDLELEGPLRYVPLEISNSHSGYRSDKREFEQVSVKGYLLNELLPMTGIDKIMVEELGFSPVQFQTAITAMWAHFNKQNAKHALHTSSSSIGFEYMMGQARIPKVVGDYILDNFCIDLNAFPRSQPEALLTDMATLADKPFGIYNGFIICLDLDFAATRMSRALWNLANDIAIRKNIGKFSGEQGGLFERYCGDLLTKIEETRKEQGSKLSNEGQLGKAKLDFLYVEGATAIAIECKTAPLEPSILYGTDAKALAQNVRDKFVFGTERIKDGVLKKNPQGFIQCATHIRTLLNNRQRYDLDSVKKIIPCLVVMEDALSYAPLFDYATHEAKPLFEEFGDSVGEPVIIHAEDLALITLRAKFASPCEILGDLGKAPMIVLGSTKNAILDSRPNAMLEVHGKVDIDRHLHFLVVGQFEMERKYLR